MVPENNTLSEIVRKFPPAAGLFEKFDLDYCCRGNVTLRQACPEEATFQKVSHALHRMMETDADRAKTVLAETLDIDSLIDLIVNRHHAYVNEAMPVISAHLDKVMSRHGHHHPEMEEICKLFGEVQLEMKYHMMKEEQVLFPRIRQVAASGNGEQARQLLEAPIRMMIKEHDHAGTMLYKIRQLTNHYEPPADACTTFRVSFEELKQFEYDLHQHVHLENNILFPRALALAGDSPVMLQDRA